MPTGYTASIQEGATFAEYVWRCARAFGALVLMRDDPGDKLPPKEFPESPYYLENLKLNEERLVSLNRKTDRELRDEYLLWLDEQEASRKRAKEERFRIEEQYLSMLAECRAWKPPSEEHQGLKDFMMSQIQDSIKFDCSSMDELYKTMPFEEWKEMVFREAKRSLEYSKEAYAAEKKRTAERNEWVRLLRESVPPPTDPGSE